MGAIKCVECTDPGLCFGCTITSTPLLSSFPRMQFITWWSKPCRSSVNGISDSLVTAAKFALSLWMAWMLTGCNPFGSLLCLCFAEGAEKGPFVNLQQDLLCHRGCPLSDHGQCPRLLPADLPVGRGTGEFPPRRGLDWERESSVEHVLISMLFPTPLLLCARSQVLGLGVCLEPWDRGHCSWCHMPFQSWMWCTKVWLDSTLKIWIWNQVILCLRSGTKFLCKQCPDGEIKNKKTLQSISWWTEHCGNITLITVLHKLVAYSEHVSRTQTNIQRDSWCQTYVKSLSYWTPTAQHCYAISGHHRDLNIRTVSRALCVCV